MLCSFNLTSELFFAPREERHRSRGATLSKLSTRFMLMEIHFTNTSRLSRSSNILFVVFEFSVAREVQISGWVTTSLEEMLHPVI